MRTSPFTSAGLAGLLAMLPLSATAQENCEVLFLHPGEETIEGTAPADDVLCYELYAEQGMVSELAITSGTNVIFSIYSLADAQQNYTLEFGQDGWTIFIGQLMRAIEDEPFTLQITTAPESQ